MRRKSAKQPALPNASPEAEDEHIKWLQERQDADRQVSLMRRLDHLADDAKIERLEWAAALLRATAEELRSALSRDQAAKASEKSSVRPRQVRSC